MVRAAGCEFCDERVIGPEHEESLSHKKNQLLFQFNKNKKKFGGNRNGIVISCNAEPSTLRLECSKLKVKVSVQPNNNVCFKFSIRNDTKKDVVLVSAMLCHSKLNFILNVNNFPVTVPLKSTLTVAVDFRADTEIGQYRVPVAFMLRKKDEKNIFVIMRELVVFVEKNPKSHEKEISPYEDKEVTANELLKCSIADRSADRFRIPKNCKRSYATALNLPENATPEEVVEFNRIRNILGTIENPKQICPTNYVDFFHELLWFEETIVRINLKKYNMTNVLMQYESTRAGDSYMLTVPGLAEKRPSLLVGDLLFIKLTGSEELMFEAKIDDIQENIAVIKGLHEKFKEVYSVNARFDVRFFMCRVTLERMHAALESVAELGLLPKLFPTGIPQEPHINRIQRSEYFNQLVGNNVEQCEAVERIVSGGGRHAPYLVHGPPGTGKTVTIVEAILQLVKANPTNRILLCTDSNMAADHAATLLVQYANRFQDDVKNGTFLLRANSRSRTWESMPECLQSYSNGTNRYNYNPVPIEKFMAYKIVVTTLSHSAVYANGLKRKGWERYITHLFIDEAAQASEPACCVPLAGLAGPRAALVLAGDPRQLPPVCISRHAAHRGLGTSLIERMEKFPMYSDARRDPNYIVMLRDNYRSHADILDIPNKLFYQGLLRALCPEDPLSRVPVLPVLAGQGQNHALEFHGVLSKEMRMGKSPSYFNEMEAEVVMQYVTALQTIHHVSQKDIGIIAPYLRQVYKLKKELKAKFLGEVEVGTVEAFQGKEKRVILISVVRANCSLLDHDAKFKLGFLVDDKRFNVAMTRAKAKVVIIGNPLCLKKDFKWLAVMHRCIERGSYRGVDYRLNDDDYQQLEPLMEKLRINDDNN